MNQIMPEDEFPDGVFAAWEVELTLQVWVFHGKVVVTVTTDELGAAVIEAAIETFLASLDKHGSSYLPVLQDDSGTTLEFDPSDEITGPFLKGCIIGANIISRMELEALHEGRFIDNSAMEHVA